MIVNVCSYFRVFGTGSKRKCIHYQEVVLDIRESLGDFYSLSQPVLVHQQSLIKLFYCAEPAISHDSHHVSLVQWTNLFASRH
jgi:hypothetical protein